MTAPCITCNGTLAFTATLGWHHLEGGGIYMMRCECGWKGAPQPSPKQCPNCGSTRGLRDDHCAHPRLS